MIAGKWVALAGGLGNQLFQYAHSISNLGEEEESTLESVGFRLGGGETLLPEISKFRLPQAKVAFDNWSKTKLEQRSFNYLLRVSNYKNSMGSLNPMALFARAVITPRVVYMSLQKSKNCSDKISRFFPSLQIGYFQDNEITQEVISKMKGLSLLEESTVLDEHISLAKVEKPLVLHIRRGDYRQNPDLGCLSENYYRIALQEVWPSREFNKIWLFSDDVEWPLSTIDASLHRSVRVIDQKISPAETFEIMRLGYGYVIANSSFSFWAAALCRNQDSRVYAPMPWFKRASFQDKNFPSGWNFIPAQFE